MGVHDPASPPSGTAETHAVVPSSPPTTPPSGTRYEAFQLLASGGMADVFRGRDLALERFVAVKKLRVDVERPDQWEAQRRAFVNEARLQASLGHPGVIPVFDVDASTGNEHFTMPQVVGRTLAEVLETPPTYPSRASWSRRALIEMLARVCLTVEFAHDRGVVHRDLKPENLMLGDFGEVYVLDWGVAARVEGRAGATSGGVLVGTLAYMSPEQARGAPTGPPSDVFALGAILFEILAGEPLRRQASVGKALLDAQRDPEVAERLQKLGVPGDLTAICERAVALDPSVRTPSARALHDAIEAWLDGERDSTRRTNAARDLTARAEAEADAGRPIGDVVRTLSRAVSLAPDYEPAVSALTNALMNARGHVPPSAKVHLDRESAVAGRRAAWLGLGSYAGWFLLLPAVFASGLRSPLALAALLVPVAVALVVTAAALRRGWTSTLHVASILSSCATIGGLAGAFGPLFVLPGVLVTNAVALLHLVGDSPRLARLISVSSAAAFLVPWILELTGVLPPSYAWRDGSMVILPRLMTLSPLASTVVLTTGALLVLVSNHMSVASAVRQQHRTRTAAVAQSHVLTQLLPQAMDAFAPPSGATRSLSDELGRASRTSNLDKATDRDRPRALTPPR